MWTSIGLNRTQVDRALKGGIQTVLLNYSKVASWNWVGCK